MMTEICQCQWPKETMTQGYRPGVIKFSNDVAICFMGENNGLTQLYELKSLISEQIREIESSLKETALDAINAQIDEIQTNMQREITIK